MSCHCCSCAAAALNVVVIVIIVAVVYVVLDVVVLVCFVPQFAPSSCCCCFWRSSIRSFDRFFVRSSIHMYARLIRSFAASIRRNFVAASMLLLGTVGKANSVDTQLYVTFVARADQSSEATTIATNADDERQR